ncbi:uncharacterized protein [Antedon mediterranea]|uniref:uncharacterized protein n=1 Tax=Antedon mediterranea TaxID=105859 RepID=UPI003AF64419
MERSNEESFSKLRTKTLTTQKKSKTTCFKFIGQQSGSATMFHDEFNCHCSICRKFYRTLISRGQSSIYIHPPLGLPKERTCKPLAHNWIKVGDRVVVKEKSSGVVKYVGPLNNDTLLPEIHVGVHLDEAIGTHAGIIGGKRYFDAPKGRGIMVKYHEVRKVKPPEKRPPLKGNAMFPSYNPSHYRKFLTRSDSNLNNTSATSNRRRAQTAPPIGQKTSEKSQTFGMVRKDPGIKEIKKRPKGQMSPQVMRHVNRWYEEYSPEQVDTMTATLRKLYIAKAKGKQELEESEITEKANRFTTLTSSKEQ